MTELTPSSRALLDAARGSGPDAAALARMRAKINGAVAVAPPAAAVAGSLAGKLGLLALTALIVTGGILFATRSHEADPVAAVQLPGATPDPIARTVREPAPPAAVTADVEIEMPAARASRPKPIELAREVELVDRAMAALRRGDTRAALLGVRAYTAEAGQRGQLAEDAAAIEVEALCTSHDAAARSRHTAFEARWPTSAQRVRLGRACAF